VLVDAEVYTYVVGMKYPMPGIAGGPSAPNRLTIRYQSDDRTWWPTADWADRRRAEDQLRLRRWGLGRSARRDPQAVLDDVLDEYVSEAGATRDYGVVLTGSLADLTVAVDGAATAELRTRRRAERAERDTSDARDRHDRAVGG
jgi:N-methylhydantoinase B